jgi:hypothetical protein
VWYYYVQMGLVTEAFNGTLESDCIIPDFLAGWYDPRYHRLYQSYARNKYGAHHRQQPLRYEAGFGSYGRKAMLHDLGRDIHPVGHMRMTERTFVRVMQQKGQVIFHDLHIGRLVTLAHDIGENTHPSLIELCGGVVGDIPQGRKTDEQRATESRVWDFLFGKYFAASLPDDQVVRIKNLVTHRENSGLHHTLEAAHDTNTFMVGLRAGRLALDVLENSQPQDDRFACLQTLGRVVTADSARRMEEHASHLSYVDRLVDSAQPLYLRIQSEL